MIIVQIFDSSIVGDFQACFLWRIVADLIIIYEFLWRSIDYYSCNQVIIIHSI